MLRPDSGRSGDLRTWLSSKLIALALFAAGVSGCRGQSLVVQQPYMGEQLGLATSEKVARSPSDSSTAAKIVLALYPSAKIDTLYLHPTSRIVEAFRFQIDSRLLGTAAVRHDARGVFRIDLYGAFDERLHKGFAPSYTLFVFHDRATTYLFDGIGARLYAGYPDSLRDIQAGLPGPAGSAAAGR